MNTKTRTDHSVQEWAHAEPATLQEAGGDLEVLLRPHLARAGARIAELEAQFSSPAWRIASKLQAIRAVFAPRGSRRTKALRYLVNWVRPMVRRVAFRCLRRVHTRVGQPRLEAAVAQRSQVLLPDLRPYDLWIARNEPGHQELEDQRQASLPFGPRISVVVPTYNTPIPFLTAMIESVRAQTYDNWELCIADGNSDDPLLGQLLRQFMRDDQRLKVEFLSENHGIAGNTNAALALATGDFVAFLDHDDTLAPFALFEVVRALTLNPGADLLYSDEDHLSTNGDRRLHPYFKPAWCPDLLRSYNYITHLAVYRRSLLRLLGGPRDGFDGAQDYDLVLRFTEYTQRVVHIPQVLYHWRSHEGSTSSNCESKLYAYAAGRKALQEHLGRSGRAAVVSYTSVPGIYQTSFVVDRRPLVSIVIPNRDQVEILRRCLRSIWQTNYDPYEIVIVENRSRQPETFAYYDDLRQIPNVRILDFDRDFNFSAAVNFGVSHAAGEVVLLLNNDTEIIARDWLDRMVEHVLRREVGAVGAKLYYPDNTVQHAGVIIAGRQTPIHCHVGYPRHHFGYFSRLLAVQNLSAVTGACVMVRKAVYEEVGGFDEEYPLAYSDIDFCFKLRERDYLVVWTPLAELYHHESFTRGYEDTPEKLARCQVELELFRRRWSHMLEAGDPYYSPHFRQDNGNFELDPNGASPRPILARRIDGPAAVAAAA